MDMTIQEFAKMLDGREMGEELTTAERLDAESLGFVVVFGYSDDGCELKGAIDSEVGCFEGAMICLDENGIFEKCDCECSHSILAKEKCKTIEVVWVDEEDQIPWTYKTDISHATFDINDGDEGIFCRGIVFDIKSLNQEVAQKETVNKNLMRLAELINIFVEAGVIKEELEAFEGYHEPIETIEQLIEAMEEEMSYWEPEGA